MPGMGGPHGGMHFQICVPQNSASGFAGMMQMGPECTFSHVKTSVKTYEADVTCHKVLMHLSMAETAPDTRGFSVAMMNMPKIPGVSGPMTVRYTFHRISASCEELKPGSMRTPDGKSLICRKTDTEPKLTSVVLWL